MLFNPDELSLKGLFLMLPPFVAKIAGKRHISTVPVLWEDLARGISGRWVF
jgi:hypothetical protein